MLAGARAVLFDKPDGSDELIFREPEGLGIDFGYRTGLGAVSVRHIGTPANCLSNVPADQFLTNSGTSPKEVLWSDGQYRWTAHNLILQSKFASGWVLGQATLTPNNAVAPDGTTTAALFTDNGVSAAHYNAYGSNEITVIAGATYTSVLSVKAGTLRYVSLYVPNGTNARPWVTFDTTNKTFDANAGIVVASPSYVDLGNGWYRISAAAVAVASATDNFIVASSDVSTAPAYANVLGNTYAGTSQTLFVADGQINRSTVPTTYMATTTAARFAVPIEYSGGGYYALVEPAATNLLVRSQAFDTATWTKLAEGAGTGDAPTLTADQAIAPDGSLTADLMSIPVRSASTRTQEIYEIFAGTAVAYAGSVYVKAQTAGDVGKQIEQGFWNDSAIVGTVVITLTADWQRVTNTATLAVSAGCTLSIGRLGTGVTTDLTAVGFYLWQAQAELGTVATSPIGTWASTVTRAADNDNHATTAIPFSATVGTLVVGGRTAKGGGADQTLWSIDDGTVNERVRIVCTTADGHLHVYVTDGGVDQADIDLGAVADDTDFTVGISWAANSIKASLNAGAVTTDTTATLPTMTTFHIGTGATAATGWNGKIRKGMYAPRVPASDAELQALQARVAA